MSDFKKSIRTAARSILAHGTPAPLFAEKKIAIVGLPRSGSSWLAKAVSLAKSVSYYFEPDNLLDKRYMYRYLSAESNDEFLKQQIELHTAGNIVHSYVISEQDLGNLLSRPLCKTVLVKWVRMVLSMDWVAKNFPDLKVVQIIRHPVPQFLSWEERGWDPAFNLSILTAQDELMGGPLRPYSDIIFQSETYWEKAAAFWASVARIQYDSHRDGWLFREHEWYCMDAAANIHWLICELGLEWTKEIDEFLSAGRKQAVGPGYGAPRDSRSEIHKWTTRVNQDTMKQISNVIEQFHLPFYKNLEPTSFHEAV